MQITIAINQMHSIDIPHSDLPIFISFLSDDPSCADFYNQLALHPSSLIRVEVAAKTSLSVAVLEMLAADSSIEVVQRVSSNSTAMESLGANTLKKMAARDVSIALELVSQLPYMKESVRKAVKAELLKHEDIDVRAALIVEEDI